MRVRTLFGIAALSVGLAACAGNPEPGEPGYAFNVNGEYAVEFVADDGQVYTGTMQLETGAGGAVTGVMAIRDPVTIDGDLEGLIIGAELTLTVPYSIIENGCSGVASGDGVVAEGGGSVAGTVEINDECAGAPFAADFTFTLR